MRSMTRLAAAGTLAALLLAAPALAPAQAGTAASAASAAATAKRGAPFEDTIAQRVLACSACHGAQGRATRDGFFPRIAGKPAGYLFEQLRSFRDGRRSYPPMAGLLADLDDDYLREIAGHFANLRLPYPPPQAPQGSASMLARGRALAFEGDPSREVPACAECHGRALTGAAPAIPGLLGLSRDYLNAQLGAWRDGLRHAAAPDCMAQVARRLRPDDVAALTGWLAAQPVPEGEAPRPDPGARLPMRCGSVEAAAPAADSSAAQSTSQSTAQSAASRDRAARRAPAGVAEVARGAYLARAGNCMGCHTVRGAAPYAGGRGVATPFGTVFASNLTPDDETGLGRWSADDFWRALHDGRSRDGRALYPAFPYPQFTRVTREDSDALFAFLRSLPAVRQPNRVHALRFPYDRQIVLEAWRWMFFRPATFVADGSRSPEWNRGAYLASGLGHCAACHGSRNALGAARDPARYDGEQMPDQGWYAPSLHDPRQAGVAGWPIDDVVRLLRVGVTGRASVAGPMAEVVRHGTQHLDAADLRAMAVYLKALPVDAPPAATASGPSDRDAARLASGARGYETHCANCHGERGEGVPGAYPALAGNRAVTMDPPINLVRIAAHGGFPPQTAGNPRPFGMPPFTQVLDDAELAAILSYVRNAWGNRGSLLSSPDVSRHRGSAGR
jgi:cytochrome c553